MKIKFPFLFLVFILTGCASIEYNILTGKENISFISEEKEVKLGRKISQQVEREYEIIKDPRLRDRVNEVGYRIVSVCDRRSLVYHFNVIENKKRRKDEAPNAFALPGGYIYINKRLLDMLDTDDELAGVLAHEVSHVVLRHNILKLQEALGTQVLLAVLSTKAPDARTVKRTQMALIFLLLHYSKERELEADRLALRYMKKAGFNPQGMIEVLEKLQKYQFSSPIREYHLRTHPYLDERIEAIKKELETNISFRRAK